MKKAKYKNTKFKTKKEFKNWLKKLTKYHICFEDKGQDFLEWWLDERGEILHCEPFQASVWNGKMVDIGSLKIGKTLLFQDGRGLKYKVITIEGFAIPAGA